MSVDKVLRKASKVMKKLEAVKDKKFLEADCITTEIERLSGKRDEALREGARAHRIHGRLRDILE